MIEYFSARQLFVALVLVVVPLLSGCEWFKVLAVPQEPQTSLADDTDEEAGPN